MSARKKPFPLPPWGQMEDELLEAIDDPLIPPDWVPPGGGAPTPKKYIRWLNELRDEIDNLIWPAFVPGRDRWNTPHVHELNDADFTLMKPLRRQMDTPINAAVPTTVLHHHLFLEEDDESGNFGNQYERYDPAAPKEVRESLRSTIRKGIVAKSGSLDLQLKQIFQRPRAYQVAFIQGRKGFSHIDAITAHTPSLVSGHCLQSTSGCCAAFLQFRQSLTPDSLEALKQLTVDVGDRRVMAGVHYPSDSLSSWLSVFTLISRVFGNDAEDVMDFLWSAVSTHSAVFAAVRAHVKKHRQSPYKRIVERLQQFRVER
jgi:hypothetical protein